MPTEEQIKKLAHTIWKEEGQPQHKDKDHWDHAQRILEEQEPKILRRGRFAIVSCVLLIGALAAGLFLPRGWNWIIVVACMLLFFLALGHAIKGHSWGVLVDERNVVTLSRFQIALWTLIIVSAYFTIVLARVHAKATDPLALELPWQVWALMGIGAASFIGSPMIRGENRDIFTKVSGKAEFRDMFRGDEAESSAYIDMAKVQMFLFTVIVAIAYATVLWNLIITKDPTTLTSLPEVNQGLVTVLGISHAAYLGKKGVDASH